MSPYNLYQFILRFTELFPIYNYSRIIASGGIFIFLLYSLLILDLSLFWLIVAVLVSPFWLVAVLTSSLPLHLASSVQRLSIKRSLIFNSFLSASFANAHHFTKVWSRNTFVDFIYWCTALPWWLEISEWLIELVNAKFSHILAFSVGIGCSSNWSEGTKVHSFESRGQLWNPYPACTLQLHAISRRSPSRNGLRHAADFCSL